MFKHTPLLLLLGLGLPAAATPAPTVMQGMEIGEELSLPVDLADWLISEKYDGVRAYWDGTRLLTRSGYPVHVPEHFTRGWPNQHLEGELWIGYGAFEPLSALVRSCRIPDDHISQKRYPWFVARDVMQRAIEHFIQQAQGDQPT